MTIMIISIKGKSSMETSNVVSAACIITLKWWFCQSFTTDCGNSPWQFSSSRLTEYVSVIEQMMIHNCQIKLLRYFPTKEKCFSYVSLWPPCLCLYCTLCSVKETLIMETWYFSSFVPKKALFMTGSWLSFASELWHMSTLSAFTPTMSSISSSFLFWSSH